MQNNSSYQAYLFRRVAAFIYDCLLLVAVFFVLTAVAIGFNQGNAIENHGFKLLLYVVGFVFFSWFWRHGGQTLGMQAWRIKVISTNEQQITYWRCLKRYFCATFLFGITLIFALFRDSGEALHDSFSSTKIVYISKG